MATDQETAQKILQINNALQAGEIDQQTANELAAEQQIQMPVVEQTVPEALQPNPPAALVQEAAPAYVPYQPTPDMINAARTAQAQPNPLDMQAFAKQQYGIDTGPSEQDIAAAQQAMQPAPVQQETVAPEQIQSQETMQPTEQQRQMATESIVKPAQEAIAEHEAIKVAQSDLQRAMIRQQDELAAREKSIQDEISKQDTSVRFRGLPEIMRQGNFEDKLGASIALFVGAVSQGLTGAKSNPVMDFIDRQVALQADKDKLSLEGKLALKKQLLEVGQMKLENFKSRSQDQYQQQLLQQKQDELVIERQKIEGDQRLKAEELFGKQNALNAKSAAYQGAVVTPEVAQSMSETEQKSLVNVRGKTYKAINPSAAQKFQDDQKAINSALAKLEPYSALVEKGLLSTLGEKGVIGALKDRAAAETMKTAIVGALRLPYTGPGALSDTERKALDKAIGEFGIFKLPPVEAAKLKFIAHDLKAELQRTAEDSGIKAQVWPEQFIKLKDNKLMSKDAYFKKKAAETGKSVEEVERLYNMTQGK